jgi:hypothetical protein
MYYAMLPSLKICFPRPQPPLAFLLLLSLLAGCGHDKGAQTETQTLPPPTDEATADQKTMVDNTLTKIEATTASLGQPRSFRSVPVIVTTEKRYLSEAKGACIKIGGRPQFILVSPAVLEFEKRLSPESKSSTLLPVLLHEIGHCYFNRSHDSSKIDHEGSDISLLTKSNTGEEVVQSLDASVMTPDNLVMERQLERYYVAEVMGLAKARNLEALNAFAPNGLSARFVKRESEESKK